MKQPLPSLLRHACAALVLLCAGAAAAVAQTPATAITFAPVDGAHYTRTSLTQSAWQAANGNVVGLNTVRASISERWERKGDNWVLHCTPQEVSIETSSPNLRLKDHLQELLMKSPYSVVFDATGTVIDVLGFDTLQQKASTLVQENEPEQKIAASILNPELQRWRITRNWNSQYAWLYGKSWAQGQEHSDKAVLQPPQSPQIDVSQRNVIDAIDAQVLIVSFENNTRVLAPEGQKQLPMKVSDKGTATLDSATGLPRQLSKSSLIELDAPGTPMMSHTETTTITWAAAAAPAAK